MARSSGYILPPDDVRRHHFRDPAFKKFMVVSVAIHIFILVLAGTVTLFRLPGTSYSPTYTVDLVTLPPSPAVKKSVSNASVKVEKSPAVDKKTATVDSRPEKIDRKVDYSLTRREAGEEDPARTDRKKRLKKLEKEAEKLFRSYSFDSTQQPVSASEASRQVTDPSAATGISQFSGPSVVGGGSRPADIRFRAYYDQIWARIKAAWALPEGVAAADGKLLTVIGIRISASGVIEEQWIERRSGNIYYDQSAVRALKKFNEANPLPPLPDGLGKETLEVGINFRVTE